MSAPVPAARLDLGERRRWIYAEGDPSLADVESLAAFAPNFGDDPEFCALLADVARDAVTRRGVVGRAEAQALIALIARADLSARARVALWRGVVAPAVAPPAALVDFALRDVERAILEAGAVEAWHVDALQVFCPAAPLTRAAAETLFDIAHATATADNDPAFAEFFARAVGAYLLGAARARGADARPGLGAILSRLFAPRPLAVERLADETYARESAATEARLAAAARIEAGEAQWLIAPLARGGALSPAETRLLAILSEPGPLGRAA